MDLKPFEQIVPCGLSDIKMIDMKSLGVARDVSDISRHFVKVLSMKLGYNPDFLDMP
jgi:lipoate-protein ligase B